MLILAKVKSLVNAEGEDQEVDRETSGEEQRAEEHKVVGAVKLIQRRQMEEEVKGCVGEEEEESQEEGLKRVQEEKAGMEQEVKGCEGEEEEEEKELQTQGGGPKEMQEDREEEPDREEEGGAEAEMEEKGQSKREVG